ncbi:transcriptional regulator [Paraburkholderia phymatum]|uniref:Transcriptional regulator n=1 Tax=Paraburkholderia phymatum TaxID=148447 RepID=A0ACC6U158_9BURK
MTLDEYFNEPGAPTMKAFKEKMNALGYDVQSPDQIRQWRHGYYKRIPSPEYCMGIHLATDGKVTLQELRPDDWQRIWPEYHGGKKTGGNGNRKTKEAPRPSAV